MNHPNVVPNLGAGPDIAELCVVSPWMPDGHLLQYINKYPGASRVSIVSVRGVHDSEILNLIPIRCSELWMGFPTSTSTMSFTET